MTNFKHKFLLYTLILSYSIPTTSISMSKKNTFCAGLIAGITATYIGTILYKKNPKFKAKIEEFKNKAENYISDDIAVPMVIKWEELKEEGLTKKDKTILAVIGASSLTIGTMYFLLNKKTK